MTLENEVFKRSQCTFETLIPFGFIKEKDYIYTINFLEDSFKAIIRINKEGEVSGQVIDLQFNEEYIVFRLSQKLGTYASRIKEAYLQILTEIKEQCFKKVYFIFPQSNRLAEAIYERYKDRPEFMWDTSPGSGVFRNPDSNKWYGLMMNINQIKLGKEDKEVEILNVKLEESKIQELLKLPGFVKAYHMNHKKWVSIILDDTLEDQQIMEYIEKSHHYTEVINEWLVPANPKYYDMLHCFKESDTMLWKQSSQIKVGHLVYQYVGAPISAILYQCVAIEVDLPFDYEDNNLTMKKAMRIKLLEEYPSDQYTFRYLNEFGIKAIRGPRRLTKELSQQLNERRL